MKMKEEKINADTRIEGHLLDALYTEIFTGADWAHFILYLAIQVR